MKGRLRRGLVIALFALALPAGEAKATLTFSYYFDNAFNGAPPSGSPLYWLTAEFQGEPGGGDVTLKLTNNLQGSGEFISQFAFNSGDVISPRNLTILPLSGTAGITFLQTGQNAQQIGGRAGKGFDVRIDFPTSTRDNRFDGTDVLSFTILGASMEIFNSQNVLENGGSGGLYAAAKVQGIGAANDLSGYIGAGPPTFSHTPIPPAYLLLGSGLAGLIVIRKKIGK